MVNLTIKDINCPSCHGNHTNINFYRVIVDHGTLSTGISCNQCNNTLELQEDTGFCDSRHEFEVNVISSHGRELLRQHYQDLKEWLIIEGGQDE